MAAVTTLGLNALSKGAGVAADYEGKTPAAVPDNPGGNFWANRYIVNLRTKLFRSTKEVK